MLVDGEDVDAAGGQGLLSAVGHAVGLGDDPALARRDDVLPIGIDADTQHARIVMSNTTKWKQQFVFNSQRPTNIRHRLVVSDKRRRRKIRDAVQRTVRRRTSSSLRHLTAPYLVSIYLLYKGV